MNLLKCLKVYNMLLMQLMFIKFINNIKLAKYLNQAPNKQTKNNSKQINNIYFSLDSKQKIQFNTFKKTLKIHLAIFLMLSLFKSINIIDSLMIINLLMIIGVQNQGGPKTATFNLITTVLEQFTSDEVIIKYNPQNSIFKKFNISETFSIAVYTKLLSDTVYELVDSMDVQYNNTRQISAVIYNLQNSEMIISVNLTYYSQRYYVNSTSNTIVVNTMDPNSPEVNVSLLTLIDIKAQILSNIIVNLQPSNVNILEKHFLAIIEKDKTNNYMLPFNLISLKKYRVFVNYINSTIVTTTYSNQPFLPTFWNQLGSSTLIIPWLPYFSECTGQKKRIMLKDLLKPEVCANRQDQSSLITIQIMSSIVCQTKVEQFKCLIEEFNVINQRREFWYQSTDDDIFYFHPDAIDSFDLGSFFNDSKIIDGISKEMYDQIPVLVTKNIGIEDNPKQFVFKFNIAIGEQLTLSIVSVSLQINPWLTINRSKFDNKQSHSNSQLSDKQVSLVVIVNYYNDMQRFYYLHYDFIYYLTTPSLFTFIVLITFFTLNRYSQIFNNFQTPKFISIVIIPMIKGLFLSSVTMYSFILIFYFIAKNTSFSIIATTFGGDDSIQSNLLKKYNGRIGLVLIISGFFILIQTIKQTFKIPTPQQMKIHLQDALQQNHQTLLSQSQSQTNKSTIQRKIDTLSQKDIKFSIKILQSRRDQLCLAFFFVLVVFQYHYKFTYLDKNLYQEILFIIVILPLTTLFFYKVMSSVIFKDIIYAKAALIVFQTHTYCTLVLKSDTIVDIFFYWTLGILSFAVIMPLYQIKLSIFCTDLSKQENPNFIEIYLLKKCKNFIKNQSKLSYYEKGIYFSSILIAQICSFMLIPFFFLTLQLSFAESKIFTDIFVNSYNFKIIVFVSICIIPSIVYIILCIIQWMDKFFDLGIFKIIELNQFTFKNRKVKWMSDIFRQNPTIADCLKEYQKFHFSSQLYFVIFSLSFAGGAIIIGLKIVFENKYICFVDPAMMIIYKIIWVVGDIMAMIISFLALRFKFYQKKQEVRMRTKLQSIQKLIRKKEYTKYLDLNAVKQYFLYNYKDWVIKNIQKIFTKNMFLQDNGKILKKFKFYKNLLKRKNMMKKRNSISQGYSKIAGFIKQNNDYRLKSSQKQLDYDVSQDLTVITVNGLLSLAKSKQQQMSQPKVIKISKQKFNDYAKPLLYYWFYTAKQNTLLKSLIVKIKQQKLQQVCQFCNMDLDLQNIQKHDIQQITSQYRVINVGKPFVPDNFIQYYRTHQQFITVCFQCKQKKLYLQKKRIKNIKYAKIIVMNWLIRCRSQKLHLNKSINNKDI